MSAWHVARQPASIIGKKKKNGENKRHQHNGSWSAISATKTRKINSISEKSGMACRRHRQRIVDKFRWRVDSSDINGDNGGIIHDV